MATYAYIDWSGVKQTVEAERIEFKAGHVVWKTMDGRIVLAERNAQVNHLVQLPDAG